MLSTEEKQSIQNGISNITTVLTSINQAISKYDDYKDTIINIIKTYAPSYQPNFPIEKFISMKSYAYNLLAFFNEPIDYDNNVQSQFKTFLITEISAFNVSQYGFNQRTLDLALRLLDRISTTDYIIGPNDNEAIIHIRSIPSNYIACLNHIASLQCKLYILNSIRNIYGSIVMIGANGSGKSTLSRKFKGTLHSNIAILSAQHILYYNKKDSISAIGNEIEQVRTFQQSDKLSSDNNFQNLLNSDMDSLINALRSQHTVCTMNYYDTDKREESFLCKTIALWNSIIIHRKLINKIEGLFVTGEGISDYDFNGLSDGEKAVFYYIGHILLAKPNSYIIIDEPNNFLHPTICIKLWDTLELERQDCKFIYLTHDLTFASSRNNCTILWNKKFVPPMTWDFEILPHDNTIPDVLVMEILGSRNQICFCEGEKGSLDYKLYSALFPEYTIIPVGGHRNVIDYTNAYNFSSVFHSRAVGIIDGDHHLPSQIEKWKKQGIITLPINEIENLLCDEYILAKSADAFCSDHNAVRKFHEKFWNLLESAKEEQATIYVNEYINNHLSDKMLHETHNISALINELTMFTNATEIQAKYDEILNEIECIISSKNYPKALKIVNFKKRLTTELSRVIVDKYEDRVIELIKKTPEIKEHIKDVYFKGLTS